LGGIDRFDLGQQFVDREIFRPGNGFDENYNPVDQAAHFFNMGMQVGPSVTVTPIKNLHARLYVHYAPSSVVFAPESFEDLKVGYAGYVTGGLHVSYRAFTLGFELRGGSTELSSFNFDSLGEMDEWDGGEEGDGGEIFNVDDVVGPKVNTKLPGTRFTFGFRF
jgi:hypothetical protein